MNLGFVAKDVCDILGIANPTDALNKGLEDFERARFNLGRPGRSKYHKRKRILHFSIKKSQTNCKTI